MLVSKCVAFQITAFQTGTQNEVKILNSNCSDDKTSN